MKKRVYTLYRVSTIGQVEKDDIPMQKEACHEFAERQGWEIVKEFSEKGVSGFKKSAKDRDQLQLLQQAAAAGEFDVLLVFMFDRLGRRDDETPFIVEWFTKQGVEVWSVNEGQQRFDSHVDKLMNYIRYWQASGESIKTSIRTRTRIEQLTVVKEKRYRYSCNFNVRHPGQCDGQSGYGVTTLDAVVESIVCMKFEEILECSKSNLLEEMRRKDLDAAKKEATRWKEEVQTKVDEQDALKKEMIRVIQGTSGLDREMIQQMVNENKEALLIAQTNLADSEKKLKEIEEQNQKAERNCSDLFTWASTYKGASFERRQAILKQFIKEVRVGRDYNIEIVLNVPLDEFEEFKRHAASAGRGKNQKNKSQNPQKVGRCTSNAGIVVLDKTAGETISIVPKNAAHAILRC